MSINIDKKYMNLAISLAKKGKYTARPNPLVGCVITKNNKIIGQGFHYKYGEQHAEINALNNVILNDKNAENSTIYVTLEPCAHFGKTPACVLELIKNKVSKVVIGNIDPNPLVKNKSIALLKKHNIEVVTGVLKNKCKLLNLSFFKYMKYQKPFITLKSAISIDGRTAMKSGESKWITNEKSRIHVHKLRAKSQLIVTAIGSLLKDNPSMLPRLDNHIERYNHPHLALFDTNLKININCKWLKNNTKKIIFHNSTDTHKIKFLLQKTEQLKFVKLDIHNLIEFETWCIKNEYYNILVEAGSTLLGSFLKIDLFDLWYIYQAPIFLGNTALPMVDFEIDKMVDKKSCKIFKTKKNGNNTLTILKN